MLYSEEKIRNQIKNLYQNAPRIHVSVSQTRPKISLKNAEATIVGAYAHFFRIEIVLRGKIEYFSIRYADILANQTSIDELVERT